VRTQGRLRPYGVEADRRARKLMTPPKNLLAWFLKEYREEMPENIHSAGVWRDRGLHAVGGSLLGSPRTAEGFRRLTEASPFTTDVAEYEGHKDRANHYAFPLRAALARLQGRESADKPWGFMAATLITTARCDGDWDRALSSLGVNPPAVRRAYLELALRQLYERYEPEPRQQAA
jgi:hypothetical protein